MVELTREKLTCLSCAKEYAVSSFYSHRNPLINEKFGFCKKCVKKDVKEDQLDTLYNFLRTMDIPYLKEYWTKAYEGSTETIGTYLKNLNSLKQNKDLRYSDSDDMTVKTTKVETAIDYSDFNVTPSMIRRWGRNLELEDYIMLEEIFETFGGYQDDTDSIQHGLLTNISKTQWMANKALEDGDHAKYEKMMNVLSKLMGDANIKPVQIKANAQEGAKMSSWGEWVLLIEEKEPVDEQDASFKDNSFVRRYITTFFFTQIKRIFGRATDEEVEMLHKAMDGKLDES